MFEADINKAIHQSCYCFQYFWLDIRKSIQLLWLSYFCRVWCLITGPQNKLLQVESKKVTPFSLRLAYISACSILETTIYLVG